MEPIATPYCKTRSTGHGLNLQDGGHIIVASQILAEIKPIAAEQTTHRSGQKHPVQIIHIVKDTADEEVVPRIGMKGRTATRAVDSFAKLMISKKGSAKGHK